MTIKNAELPPELKLAKLCYFVPDFRIWTGQSILKASDIKLGKDGSLPPKGVLAELGMKNLVEPKTLHIFNTVKRRAIRHLEDAGVQWLNGYAVPLERAKEVMRQLDTTVRDFNDAVASFITSYDHHVESWIQSNPGFAAELKSAMKSRESVAGRFHASYVAARLQPISEEEAESFNREVQGLSGKLFRSVTQIAERFFEESLAQKNACRSAETLQRIRAKLDGLRFLDAGITPLVEMIDRVLSHLPPKGPKIEGPVFWELTAVILMLCDRNKMRLAAEGRFSLEESAKALAPSALIDIPMPENTAAAQNVQPAREVQPVELSAAPRAVEANAETEDEATLPFDFETSLERFFNENAESPVEAAGSVKSPAEEEKTVQTEPKVQEEPASVTTASALMPETEATLGEVKDGALAQSTEPIAEAQPSAEAAEPASQGTGAAGEGDFATVEAFMNGSLDAEPANKTKRASEDIPPAPPEDFFEDAFCGVI